MIRLQNIMKKERTIDIIKKRRSIRYFSNKEIDIKDLNEIISAGTYAPSPKNRQPWMFIVITENEKMNMINVIQKGLEREKNGEGVMKNYISTLPGAFNTLEIMRQAPITIFVFNTSCKGNQFEIDLGERLFQISNVQAIGACIQNMLLTATEKNIGSLWICDIFYAYQDICEWLNVDYQLVSAISFGYPKKYPQYRQLKSLEEVTKWM